MNIKIKFEFNENLIEQAFIGSVVYCVYQLSQQSIGGWGWGWGSSFKLSS